MSQGGQRSVFLGITAGLVLGLAGRYLAPAESLGWVVDNLAVPVGQIFLRLLFMLAVPVVFSALVVGVGELDLKSLGRVGLRTLLLVTLASAIAVIIGLVAVNVVQPGVGHADLRELATRLAADRPVAKAPEVSGVQMLITMVPDNPFKAAATGDMLGLIVFALLFGIGLAQVKTTGTERLREAISGLFDVSMYLLGGILRLAPVGVGALLFATMATVGLEVLGRIALYVAVVVGSLALHMFGTFPLMLKVLARRDPIEFFRRIKLAISTAFATASSSATLPVSLELAEKELHLSRRVSRFVLTAGASMNQNGTALFEGVTVLFIAQLFGVELALGQQAMVMLICILGGIGTAGIPGASIPVIAMILGMLKVPPEGLALIMGVDRVLDMCRTTLNVVGDLVIATCVDAGEPRDPEEQLDGLESPV